MHVLVTGSSGVLGQPLCDELRRLGHEVDEYDLLPSSSPTRKSVAPPRDIRDAGSLKAAIAQADGVIHLAAVSRCAPAEADPALARSVNVEGTRTVADSVHSANPNAWLILSSSREVYGEQTKLPVGEDAPVTPKNVYGRSKAAAEEAVIKALDGNGGRATILRLTNLYGNPADYRDRAIPAFMSAAQRGSDLEVRGPDQLLDVLHVSDAVHAVIQTIDHLESSAGGIDVFNIASGQGVSLLTIAQKVVACTKSDSRINEVAPVAWTPSRYVADISRARASLRWQPTVSLDEGLRTLARAYQDSPGSI
jgi:UDP-glucose 4-epimerase